MAVQTPLASTLNIASLVNERSKISALWEREIDKEFDEISNKIVDKIFTSAIDDLTGRMKSAFGKVPTQQEPLIKVFKMDISKPFNPHLIDFWAGSKRLSQLVEINKTVTKSFEERMCASIDSSIDKEIINRKLSQFAYKIIEALNFKLTALQSHPDNKLLRFRVEICAGREGASAIQTSYPGINLYLWIEIKGTSNSRF